MARPYSCLDRMCGAEDCPRCHPGNFVDGVFVDDIEDECEHDWETIDDSFDHAHGTEVALPFQRCAECGEKRDAAPKDERDEEYSGN